MTKIKKASTVETSTPIDVVESSGPHKRGRIKCEIGRQIEFDTANLESYLFATRDPVVYDTLLLAAAVEFADRLIPRSKMTWERKISLNIPVHDLSHWTSSPVSNTLRNSLGFLTGDLWDITFYAASKPIEYPQPGLFSLPSGIEAVMPFSDGLDSRAVAGLMSLQMGNQLLRVRLGTKDYDGKARNRPFQAVPYKVSRKNGKFVESSARSRGFKFAIISGLTAYLAQAGEIIVSESGQGSLGPALVTVGQAHSDYRNHPLFLDKISQFLQVLLKYTVSFKYPRIWHTKAETLREFFDKCDDRLSWTETKSCWQQNRQSSVDGKWRHCGICAACILRRMSVHAAGLTERPETYIWENLGAATFTGGANASFAANKITRKMREYAIAGILHMDHLAALRSSPTNRGMLNLTAFKLARSFNLPEADVLGKLDRLLTKHEEEWKNFMSSLGESAFVARWAAGEQ